MCKHPLKAFQIGFNYESGKPKYKITAYSVPYVYQVGNSWFCPSDDRRLEFTSGCEVVRDFVEIPCGKCIDCMLQRSRQWADRCMLELKYHDPEYCWFLTLTYDDDHIHDFGHDIFPGTLYKPDLQLFMKRLRRYVDEYNEEHHTSFHPRFFACGEYGSKTFRPHYHMILYSVPFDDRKFFSLSKKGYPLYTSEKLDALWKNGFCNFGRVTWDTCAYTARYVLKKADGILPSDYINQGLIPEFTNMSRKPGIGYQYFEDNYKKIYQYDEIILSTPTGGKKSKPPRYFDRKFEEIDPEAFAEIKERRKLCAEENVKQKLLRTNLDYEELLEVEEKCLIARTKILRERSLSYANL